MYAELALKSQEYQPTFSGPVPPLSSKKAHEADQAASSVAIDNHSHGEESESEEANPDDKFSLDEDELPPKDQILPSQQLNGAFQNFLMDNDSQSSCSEVREERRKLQEKQNMKKQLGGLYSEVPGFEKVLDHEDEEEEDNRIGDGGEGFFRR